MRAPVLRTGLWMGGAWTVLQPDLAAASGTEGAGGEELPAELISDTSMMGSLIWVIVSLILVIGLIILFVKFLSQRSRSFGINRAMRTLGGVGLGPNKSLQVVELGGKVYILGVGDDITLLDTVKNPEEVEALLASLEQPSTLGVGTLSGLLGRLRGRAEQPQPGEDLWQTPASFQDVLDEKLQRQAERKQQVRTLLDDSKQRDRLDE
ncbi:flagellar biosynthetic protein FliO [Paenibacillus sp. 1P07SE]|uniref:flagellar biosynthetic protein FliO n=1 Tax=Paenibacillus sp. 1P07SE TaxID=3132209 RepID=UPI0039A6B369